MGYSHVDPAALPAAPDRPSTKRSISDAAGLENLAAHVYTVAPGEAIPLAYHVHGEQEELFYVLGGELHVETPEGEYAVGADEAFAVEPESPQRAFVPDDGEPTRALVVGAPPVDDVRAYDPE
jgi:uncharacterized cupin superfamily protein